jgi:cysteine desulfurase
MKQGIYLDNATATHPSAQAISKMLPFLIERWGSPSSPHQGGHQLFPAIQEAYENIYSLIGAKESDDFVFTSSGTEAVNQVILSTYFDITRHTGKNQFVTSNIDEAPSIMAIGRLEQLGCVGKMADADHSGTVTAASIADSITPRTALVSLSWANGLTGVVNPVGEIATLCEERGIKLHLDATHVLGKLFYELEDVGAHFISFNGNHLHAPPGTGGLYIKEGTKCSPFILGGIEQGGYRAGSLDVPGLVALGQAAKESLECRDLLCTEVARLRDKLERGVLEKVPDAVVFFRDQERIPNCTAIAFPGIANEALLHALYRKGV